MAAAMLDDDATPADGAIGKAGLAAASDATEGAGTVEGAADASGSVSTAGSAVATSIAATRAGVALEESADESTLGRFAAGGSSDDDMANGQNQHA